MTVETKPTAPRTWAQTITPSLRAALQHPWVESIVRLSAVEDTLSALHPLLSLSHVRARVVRVLQETPSTKTFVLQPNALWAGAQAGQFVTVHLEINGRQVERIYSLSSRPGSRRLALTVKLQPEGLVSRHLHENVKAGDVLTISQANGDFVLPLESSQLPEKILLLSAGSGITPVMAMLRDLQARCLAGDYAGDLVFLHICRNPEDLIFGDTLQTISNTLPNLKLVLHFTQTQGRFTSQDLLASVPDAALRTTWMCGPSDLMTNVQRFWSDKAIAAPLHSERFVGIPLLPAAAPGKPALVRLAGSGKSFTTSGTEPLLMQAERAGLTPKHGCRIGICRSCQCTKKSGTTENLQTGEISSAPNELIRLCISVARSDIALDL